MLLYLGHSLYKSYTIAKSTLTCTRVPHVEKLPIEGVFAVDFKAFVALAVPP